MVSTEREPERVTQIVSAVRGAVGIPVWVKLTGQSERVPELADAAFQSGAEAVVMAARLLGLIPDVDTFGPLLETTLGVGGGLELPLTCQWLAMSRAQLGPAKPLIGINGAQTGLDVARMMLAGAFAVEMSSAVSVARLRCARPGALHVRGLPCKQEARRDGSDGRAADNRKAFAAMPLRRDNWRNYVPRLAGANESPAP